MTSPARKGCVPGPEDSVREIAFIRRAVVGPGQADPAEPVPGELSGTRTLARVAGRESYGWLGIDELASVTAP